MTNGEIYMMIRMWIELAFCGKEQHQQSDIISRFRLAKNPSKLEPNLEPLWYRDMMILRNSIENVSALCRIDGKGLSVCYVENVFKIGGTWRFEDSLVEEKSQCYTNPRLSCNGTISILFMFKLWNPALVCSEQSVLLQNEELKFPNRNRSVLQIMVLSEMLLKRKVFLASFSNKKFRICWKLSGAFILFWLDVITSSQKLAFKQF